MAYMYGSAKDCVKDGNHLTSCDEDGYCNLCGYQESADDIKKEEVKNWMYMAIETDRESYVDSAGEWNCTTLAENAAFNFDNEGWLDDETHWVWDIAVEVTKGTQ